jgi:putative ABC transport system substrate-binding protein
MMNRRMFIAEVAGTCLAVSGIASAQPRAKVWRIGYLGNTPPINPVFEQALRQLGYVEGTTVVFERRFADGRDDRNPALAAELAKLELDVLVVTTGPAAIAAKEATTTIPIVMAGTSDPVGRGLVASLARPGGNLTGVANLLLELNPKRLEILKQAVPKIVRVASVGTWEATVDATLTEQEAAARAIGLVVHRIAINAPSEFDKVAAAVVREQPDAMLLLPGPLTVRLRKEFAEFALAQRLPTMGWHGDQALAGIMMIYGPSNDGIFRDTATYVDKILKGAKVAELPVEQPTKIELIINLRTAKALGLTLPPSLVQRADEVIR